MLGLAKGLATGMLAGAVLLGYTAEARAQATTTSRPPTTVTTTTSTTSTTLSPHPFSKATAACIRTAKADFRACRRGGGSSSACTAEYQAAFPKCFAAPAGVKCATTCVTKENTCLAGVPKAKTNCRKSCATTRGRDKQACHLIADGDNIWAGGDAACLSTADANFALCRFVCTQAEFDCHVGLKFCVANCPNL